MMPQNTSIKGKLDLSKLNESLFSVPLQDVDKVVDKDDEELKGKDSPELPSINERLGLFIFFVYLPQLFCFIIPYCYSA